MRDARSSNRSGGGTAKTSRLSGFHLGISAFAALAGVVFAGIQAFSPTSGSAPINVTVALDPAKPGDTADRNLDVTKTAGLTTDEVNAGGKGNITTATLPESGVQMAALDLSHNLATAALKDGSDQRYRFRDLFDGRPETSVLISAPDKEINVLLDLGGDRRVSALEYVPTPDAQDGARANVLDVMALPEGALEASGRPIFSFPLQTEPGRQTFSLPGQVHGKYLWLRIAGPADAEKIAVGDFRILQ
jgi:hypothetical protein